jgi:hypothetical protein
MALDQKGSIMAEYVWIDAAGGLRSKSRVSLSLTHPFAPNLAIAKLSLPGGVSQRRPLG